MKCGYIALLGLPNAGKSTLLNALVGRKIAAVSAKPQTTRTQILGIQTSGDSQFIYMDTPGFHNKHKSSLLHKIMHNAAWSTLQDADIICYLVSTPWQSEDGVYLSQVLQKTKKPVFVLVTKMDCKKKFILDEEIKNVQDEIKIIFETLGHGYEDKVLSPLPVLTSAKVPEQINDLQEKFKTYLPEGPWLFPEGTSTNQTTPSICSEMIREQLFRQLGAELPYGCAVNVDSLEEKESLVKLKATISVEKTSHKAMVIGNKGSKIKSIGTEARIQLERHFGRQVHLELRVQIKEDWSKNHNQIQNLLNIS